MLRNSVALAAMALARTPLTVFGLEEPAAEEAQPEVRILTQDTTFARHPHD